MSKMKMKHLGFFLFIFTLTSFFACAHQQSIDPNDTNVEVWKIKFSGQTKGNLEMVMKRVPIGNDTYSVFGKISGPIDDHRGGYGEAKFNFNGKIEKKVFSARLGGRADAAEGPSSINGKMKGNFELVQGTGQWTIFHALGSSSGKYVMVKLR